MRNQSNKVGILYGVIIVAALSAFLISYYQKNRVPTIEERTAERAELVGRRLIEDHFEQKSFLPGQPQERGLASANESLVVVKKNLSGEVGRDAWGQPYFFQVKGDGVKDSTLYIWSIGANGNPDYQDPKDLIARGATGDDILVTIPF